MARRIGHPHRQPPEPEPELEHAHEPGPGPSPGLERSERDPELRTCWAVGVHIPSAVAVVAVAVVAVAVVAVAAAADVAVDEDSYSREDPLFQLLGCHKGLVGLGESRDAGELRSQSDVLWDRTAGDAPGDRWLVG